MKLTGKAKQDFEVYYINTFGPENWNSIDAFFQLAEAMQWGVYVDFFDSKEMIIDVYKDPADENWTIEINYKVSGIRKTLPEARSAAIEKANEIYNS